MADGVDIGLELLIVEGAGGAKTRHALRRTKVHLGRLEPGDEPNNERVGFADPTVSRIHAELEWSAPKQAYLIHHRSQTNKTMVNGVAISKSQQLRPGDQIRMGHLLVQLCKSEAPAAVPKRVESLLHLLVATGPDRGALHRLSSSHLLIRSQTDALKSGEMTEIHVDHLGDTELELREFEGNFRVSLRKSSETVRMFDAFPGVVREIHLSADSSPQLEDGSLLLCGSIVLAVVSLKDSQQRVRQALDGQPVSALQESLRPGFETVWAGPEEFSVRVLFGPLRGTSLWVDPNQLDTPILMGPERYPGLTLEIPTDQSPLVELMWTLKGPLLRNLDPKLKMGLNWEELPPQSKRTLVSGDRFQLGASILRYDDLPLHAHLLGMTVSFRGEEIGFQRELSLLGSSATSNFFLQDQRLAPTHGRLRVTRAGEVYYQHLDPTTSARIGEDTVTAEQERLVPVGEPIELAPGVEIEILREEGLELPEAELEAAVVAAAFEFSSGVEAALGAPSVANIPEQLEAWHEVMAAVAVDDEEAPVTALDVAVVAVTVQEPEDTPAVADEAGPEVAAAEAPAQYEVAQPEVVGEKSEVAQAEAAVEEVQPEVSQPEGVGEEVQPEVAQPEVVVEEVQPEVARPEVVAGKVQSEVAQPEVVGEEVQPEVARPEVVAGKVQSEVAQPEVVAEEIQPEVAQPEVAVTEVQPEVAQPEVAVTEVQPEAAQPESAVTEVQSEVAQPEVVAEEAQTEIAQPEVAVEEVQPEVVQPEVAVEDVPPEVAQPATAVDRKQPEIAEPIPAVAPAESEPEPVAAVAAISAGKKMPVNRGGRKKVGRNDLCPCGSGKKYKKCCGN